MIPFSPPRMDEITIREVADTLLSGWITTGPKTKLFEKKISEYCGGGTTLCTSSATAGLEIVLRWFGVEPGDEVIIPVYTYCATANVVMHCGAKPVMVDINPDDFTISVDAIEKAITARTKAIIPVDLGGWPCDYDRIMTLVRSKTIQGKFTPSNDLQRKLKRILVLSDAAHSFGAYYKGRRAGVLADITVFSFHAVKNLTTAEGGAIVYTLPIEFNHQEIYKEMNIKILHGQSKDAFSKAQLGNWRYDVVAPGYKANMTDITASIGLVELARYDNDMLPRRKIIFEKYTEAFSKFDWFQKPPIEVGETFSSFHVYLLRIRNIGETVRDAIISSIFAEEVCVNVHFIPLPMFTCYKEQGYIMNDYPVAFDSYSREISLPVYYDLTDDQVDEVIRAVIKAVEENLKSM